MIAVHVVEDVDFDVQVFLKLFDELEIALLCEDNVDPVLTSSSSAPCPMHKRVCVAHRVLDNHIDIVDIETSSRDVSGDKYQVGVWSPIRAKRVLSLRLRDVTSEDGKLGISLTPEVLSLALCLGENEHLLVFVLGYELFNLVVLLSIACSKNDVVGDRIWDLSRVSSHQVD